MTGSRRQPASRDLLMTAAAVLALIAVIAQSGFAAAQVLQASAVLVL